MHRSGTTLLAKVLEKGGIFMGVFKDHNFESIPFLAENQKVLEKAKGNWLNPVVPAQTDWTNYSGHELYKEHFSLNGFAQNWAAKLRSPKWGFKDPRNSFTLDMWLSKFPESKVIHITRNKKDVALSLKKRNQKQGEVSDEKLDNLTFNEHLWQIYVEQCSSYKEKLGPRYIEIKYEDILDFDPLAIRRLEDFTKCSLMQHFKYFVR